MGVKLISRYLIDLSLYLKGKDVWSRETVCGGSKIFMARDLE